MITPMTTRIPAPARRDIAYAVVLSMLGTALMYDNAARIERDGDVPGTATRRPICTSTAC